MNEQVNDSLNSLLEETNEALSVRDLFETDESYQEFVDGVGTLILQSWANFNEVTTILVPVGYGELVKSIVDASEAQADPSLFQIFGNLKNNLQYQEIEGLKNIVFRTLLESIGTNQLLSAHKFLEKDQGGLFAAMEKEGLVVFPSYQEARLLVLMNALLDARENRPRESRIITPNMRSNVRTLR